MHSLCQASNLIENQLWDEQRASQEPVRANAQSVKEEDFGADLTWLIFMSRDLAKASGEDIGDDEDEIQEDGFSPRADTGLLGRFLKWLGSVGQARG